MHACGQIFKPHSYCHSCRFNALRWSHNERDGVSKQQASLLFTQPFIQAQSKKHQSSASQAFVGEFTADQWIPRTKTSSAKKFPVDSSLFKSYCVRNKTILKVNPGELCICSWYLRAVYGYPHGKVIKRWKNGGCAQMMIHLWPPFTNMV